MENGKEGFYVRLPLQDSLRILQEVGSAFQLLLWLYGRTSIEFRVDGFKLGGALGFRPINDGAIAGDMARFGIRCNEDKIWRWRNKLASMGIVCQFRTPYGHRLGVLFSDKFPDHKAETLPAYAVSVVREAFELLMITRNRISRGTGIDLAASDGL